MQTLQNDSRNSAASTSACNNYYGSGIPYLAEQSKSSENNIDNCKPYGTTKKRVIIVKRVYSTRTRGHSGGLRSLARKLGRFKVRTVVVEETATQECQQNK
ncbi:hypothetical protein RJT34_19657 [Clitoria ternatea]|uniref:Uncharacterized protein n=1 Tax=Clitoria ternatea TaxID=43366 RepID=A0AAN9IRG3_CLITE